MERRRSDQNRERQQRSLSGDLMSLPLDEDYFENAGVKLSSEQVADYRRIIEEAIPKILHRADSRNDEENGFTDMGTQDGVAMSQAAIDGGEIHLVRGTTTAQTDVEWLASRMITTNTDEFRHCYNMIDPLFLEGHVLNVLSCNEEDPKDVSEPFFNIKWAVFNTEGQGVVWNRDVCYLEYIAKLEDENGVEFGIGACLSIDFEHCPSLEESHSLVRGHIFGGYMAQQTDVEGEIKLTYMMQIDPKVISSRGPCVCVAISMS